MKANQQRRIDALLRVREFLDTNAAAVGALATSPARRELDDSVSALVHYATSQGSTNLDMVGQLSTQRALETDVRDAHMKPIATFARARLRGAPDLAALTHPMKKLHGARLVHAARAMATVASRYTDAFVAHGLPAELVAQLASAADTLQAKLSARANAKVTRIGATKAIEQKLVEGREAVDILHAIISRQFAGDATFLAGWNAARRINKKVGAVRSTAEVGVEAAAA